VTCRSAWLAVAVEFWPAAERLELTTGAAANSKLSRSELT